MENCMLLTAIVALALSAEEYKPSNDSVYFAKGSATIDAAQEKGLERKIQWLHGKVSGHFVLLPHTSSDECSKDCFALAESRAKAVAQWLAQHGAAADRFEIGEHTNELPDLDQNTAKKPATNFDRRVEFFGYAL
jgi:outer membrane protein OmpA-like peptidoglycan-associated protein